jgi:hypothetical protein
MKILYITNHVDIIKASGGFINDYQNDLRNAIFYIPFFTAVWFGSLPYDDLIDKNWPFFFIQKYSSLLHFISI